MSRWAFDLAAKKREKFLSAMQKMRNGILIFRCTIDLVRFSALVSHRCVNVFALKRPLMICYSNVKTVQSDNNSWLLISLNCRREIKMFAVQNKKIFNFLRVPFEKIAKMATFSTQTHAKCSDEKNSKITLLYTCL